MSPSPGDDFPGGDSADSGLSGDAPAAGDLPGYTVRISARARRISLRVSAQGVEVVLPRGADPALAARAVRDGRQWIARQQARLGPQIEAARRLPQLIELAAIGERWPLDYHRSDGPLRLRETGGTLVLRGDCQPQAVARCLRRWLIGRARQPLAARLDALLAEHGTRHGLGYARLAVRCQRSRWGSYSARGTLSLNAALLLLDPAQLDYVLLHELAHSRHPDHSADFWALLERLCPGARAIDRRINRAARALPGWLTLD